LIRPLVVVACALVACAPRPQTTTATTTSTTTLSAADYRKNLKLSSGDVRIERGFMYVTGSVTNRGQLTVTYWKAAVKFLDSTGRVIDTDYVNSPDTLGPDESKRWELMHKNDPAFKDLQVAIEEVVTR
jgi:hypothetical protein